MQSMREICQTAPVVPVLVLDDVTLATPLAELFVDSGLSVIEVTLRTPSALAVIEAMAAVEGACVGAGTVLTAEDVQRAKQHGAQFVVSPGATDELIAACKEHDIALLPGAATATEVMRLVAQGFDTLKFFPAEAAGGVAMLSSFSGPLSAVQFCPTGGVKPDNAETYLALPNVCCVGGTWLLSPKLLAQFAAGDDAILRQLAKDAAAL